jgi:hypothetical protein
LLYCAWKHGGEDPYLLFNGPSAGPSPNPDRVAAFILGCAMFAEEREIELATGKSQSRMLRRGAGVGRGRGR